FAVPQQASCFGLNRGIRIAKFGEISSAGARVQFGQQSVIELLGLELCDAIVGIFNVTEDDGLRGTGLLAGGLHLAIPDVSVFDLRADLGFADSLHTIGAFLHDAAAADRYIGIALELPAFRGPIRKQQEIEAPDLVGAIVRAIARAYATVVDHVVQTVGAVIGGLHWANQFARRVLALHARNR